jgi:hypothetical protein
MIRGKTYLLTLNDPGTWEVQQGIVYCGGKSQQSSMLLFVQESAQENVNFYGRRTAALPANSHCK